MHHAARAQASARTTLRAKKWRSTSAVGSFLPQKPRKALRVAGWVGVVATAFALQFAFFPDAIAGARDGRIFFNPVPAELIAEQAVTPLEPEPGQLVEVDPAEARLLAATTWAEARSEGEDGMRAVAHVMVNRVGPRFGDDLRTVIMAPKQFSAWNRGDPNRPLAMNPDRYARGGENLDTWIAAQRIATEVLSGASIDPTEGSLFYHTRAVNPRWARYGQDAQIIGAHIFYRDVPNHVFRSASRSRGAVTQVAQRSTRARGPRVGRVNGVIQYAPRNWNEVHGGETANETTPAPTLSVGGQPVAMNSSLPALPTASAPTAAAF